MVAASLLEAHRYEQAVSALLGPGAPRDGYMQKFIGALLVMRKTRGAPRGKVDELRPSLSTCAGVRHALVRLTNLTAEDVQRPCVSIALLRVLAEELRCTWRVGGPTVPRPRFTEAF